MTANDALLIVVGLTGGYCLGWVMCWRHARKLEHHGVNLAEWDEVYDAQAPRQTKQFGRGA